MKFILKIFKITILPLIFLVSFSPAYAVHVNGYYRSNGTYVNGYERTSPDGNPYNNYSYPGNYNPNTGTITGGDPQTYLNNYYSKSSSYGTTYSYPTVSTCPLNSYYDGISSCKCNYGYVVSGSSCISADSLCWNQTGYNSSYDSLSNTCKCDYGYVLNSTGTCVSGNSYCYDRLGLMSQYNNLSNKCECMSGYEFNGVSCVNKSYDYSYPTNDYTNSISCPENSHLSTNDSTKCNCDVGYQINSAGDACVLKITKSNSQVCQDYFGSNVDWAGTYNPNNGQPNCSCKYNFIWNESKTACVNTPILESISTNTPEVLPPKEVKEVKVKEIKPSVKNTINKTNIKVSTTSTMTSIASTTKNKTESKKGWWGTFKGWFSPKN